MVLGCAYCAFIGIVLVYVWVYEMLSDLIVFLDDTLVFGTDLVIENLEVDFVASRSEAVQYGVVGCNEIPVLIDLEGGDNNCVWVTIVGHQDVLITASISDG